MNTMSRITTIGIVTLLLCSTASAELYQWKDATGKAIFSDRPPVETQKADTVGGSDSKKESADDPRNALAREEAARKRTLESEKKNKKLVKWRCVELEKQYAALLEKQNAMSKVDTNKAAAIQADADSHKVTIEKMCE